MAKRKPTNTPPPAEASAGDEAAKAAAKEAAKLADEAKAAAAKTKRDTELPHEVKQRLAGIFRDDPVAEAYYSADGLTFLNEAQYEKLEKKAGYVKFVNPEHQ